MRKYFLKRLSTGDFRKLEELMAGRDRLPHGGVSRIFISPLFQSRQFLKGRTPHTIAECDFFRDKPKDRYREVDVRASRWDGFCAFIGASVFLQPFPGPPVAALMSGLAFV
jgi:hypothetical protein